MTAMSDFTAAAFPDELQRPGTCLAEERILWALEKHRTGLALTSSFGIQAAVLLHMVLKLSPDIPIIDIDTQHKHIETYKYKQELIKQLDLKIITYRADMSEREQMALYGPRWKDGLANDDYKYQNKVEPMNRAKKELGITGWISGLRRGQSDRRADLPVIELDSDGTEKMYPLIDWSETRVIDYMSDHGLPFHPLSYEGYRTIGDYFEKPDIRAECGLHVPLPDPGI